MKKLFAAAMAAGAMATGAWGKVVYSENFDALTPGMHVPKWGISGASHKPEEVRAVSNMEAASAPNSMLIDTTRKKQGEGAGYYTTYFPKVGKGRFRFSLAFMLQQGNVNGEIRTTGKKAWISHVIMFNDEFRAGAAWGGSALGKIDRYKWHKLTMDLPTKENDDKKMTLRLQPMGPDGKWEEGRELKVETPKKEIDGEYNSFDFNVPAGVKIYIDDIKVEEVK